MKEQYIKRLLPIDTCDDCKHTLKVMITTDGCNRKEMRACELDFKRMIEYNHEPTKIPEWCSLRSSVTKQYKHSGESVTFGEFFLDHLRMTLVRDYLLMCLDGREEFGDMGLWSLNKNKTMFGVKKAGMVTVEKDTQGSISIKIVDGNDITTTFTADLLQRIWELASNSSLFNGINWK